MDFTNEKNVKDRIFKIENGLEINLVSSLNHLLNSQFAFNQEKKLEMESVLNNATLELTTLKMESNRWEVQEKYDYLIDLIKNQS